MVVAVRELVGDAPVTARRQSLVPDPRWRPPIQVAGTLRPASNRTSTACLSSSARALTSVPRSRSTNGPRITIPSIRPRSTSRSYVPASGRCPGPPASSSRHRFELTLLLAPGQHDRGVVCEAHGRLDRTDLGIRLALAERRATLIVALERSQRLQSALPFGRSLDILHQRPDPIDRRVDLGGRASDDVSHVRSLAQITPWPRSTARSLQTSRGRASAGSTGLQEAVGSVSTYISAPRNMIVPSVSTMTRSRIHSRRSEIADRNRTAAKKTVDRM